MKDEKVMNPLAQFYQETPTLPDPIDTLKREDYPSKEAWIEACANLAVKRNTPEFQRALSDIRAKVKKRDFEEGMARLQVEKEKMVTSYKLSEQEIEELNKKASEEVLYKVKCGEISAENMVHEINVLSLKYQHEMKKQKVNSDLTNAALRAALGTTFKQEDLNMQSNKPGMETQE